MEIEYSPKKIEFRKELNNLDKFVIDFCSVLNKTNIKYVIISGYVSILFGRNRASEDVDLFIEPLSYPDFKELWKILQKDFECINISNSKEAYYDYLKKDTAIRFSRKEEYIPNMELKFTKLDIDNFCLNNKVKVIINNKSIYISPIELQIAFKLFLSSEKDIEDAKYLYHIFKENLNNASLEDFFRKLKIDKKHIKHLE